MYLRIDSAREYIGPRVLRYRKQLRRDGTTLECTAETLKRRVIRNGREKANEVCAVRLTCNGSDVQP
jgi:hypothetical protein